MNARDQHPDKDLRKLMAKVMATGWTFTRGSKYFKGRCPCGKHTKTVRLTPSGANYGTNLAHWFMRVECWPKEVKL